MKIVCFGPGPQFKGGIANYNTSLAKALDHQGHQVTIVSWTQQYPAIIPRDFIDRASRSDQLEGTQIRVRYITNYNNPATWRETIRAISELTPDAVIFQWAIAIQGLPLGRIAAGLKKRSIRVVFDLHFVIQKEHSSLDKFFSKYALRHADMFVTHALKTFDELKVIFPDKSFALINDQQSLDGTTPVLNLYHPVYDMFVKKSDFDIEAFKILHGLKKHVFIFFGFIRKYKGLHDAISAFKLLSEQREDVSLLICGESFWKPIDQKKLSSKIKSGLFGIAKKVFLRRKDDEQDYDPLQLISTLHVKDVKVFNEFIPNEDVHQYFQASDAVLLFYEYATPSGVESIAYNFQMPLLATAVGHFPETVRSGFNGYLARPGDIADMARIMDLSIRQPIDREHVAETTRHMSWDNYATRIIESLSLLSDC